MKYVMHLILTISLSAPAYSDTAVNRAAAPSADESITGSESRQTVYHSYDNSDTIQTGQSATKREYQYDSTKNACRFFGGIWLYKGDVGYNACMESADTQKK